MATTDSQSDQKAMTEGLSKPKADWLKDATSIVGGVIVAAGVVVYGLLATAYDKFYAELGLTPADVGMQYGKTLGGAAALAIVVFVLMGFTTWAFWKVLRSERFRKYGFSTAPFIIAAIFALALVAAAFMVSGPLASLVLLLALVVLVYGLRRRKPTERTATMALAAGAAMGVTWLLLSLGVSLLADWQADKIKGGGWVEPPASGGLVFFSVRAMPTELEAATKADSAFVAERNGHRLRYLGASSGLLVIYDATTQEALILPATQFRTPILNCETTRLAGDERCKQYAPGRPLPPLR